MWCSDLLCLQNNLDELFMLMHFLDAGKVGIRNREECFVLVNLKSVMIILFMNSIVLYLMFDHLQFASLEEFQEEFKDINQEEQISRLHKMLAPHLLRSNHLKLGHKNFLQSIVEIYSVSYILFEYCVSWFVVYMKWLTPLKKWNHLMSYIINSVIGLAGSPL